jgi:hypothetical protein
LVSEYLSVRDIFLSFRFLKRQYHNSLNFLEKLILEEKFLKIEIDPQIIDS